jgi:hypothetical protein
MANGSETVTLKLPTGESVDAIVPAGSSDAQIKALMQQKHPEFFKQPTQAPIQQTKPIPGAPSGLPGVPQAIPEGLQSQPPGAVQRFKEGLRGGMGMDPKGTLGSDLSDIGEGFRQMGTHPLDSAELLGRSLLSSQQAPATQGIKEMQSPDWATKIKGGVRWAESGIPLAGPILSGAGDQFSRGNIAGGMGTMTPLMTMETLRSSGLASVDPAMVKDVLGKVTDATKLINRQTFVDKGRAALANGQVKPALNTYVGAVKNEIGQSVDSVLRADEMDLQGKGAQAGLVDATKGAAAARAFAEKTGGELGTQAEKLVSQAESLPTRNLRTAKDFTTTVGETAAALRRSGNLQDAGALDILYNELHKATADRAGNLGAPYSKLWQHYIDEHRTLKTMQEGLMGDLMDENVPANVLSKLTDPKRAAELSDIKDNMRAYNLDIDSLTKAQESASNLAKLSETNRVNLFGKLKAISKHPLYAGTAAVAASKAGYMSGVPGLGFVLPILVAGKVAGMLDARQLTELVNDITANAPKGAERVLPQAQGVFEKPELPPPTAGPAGSVPPTGPASPITIETDSMGIRWAKQGNYRVSIPKSVADADIEAYAKPKLAEQAGIHGSGMESSIQNMLKDQFKFTDAAARSVTNNIAGKYSTLDEGLRMAMAEAVQRAKGARK